MLEGQEHEIKKLDFREDRLASTSRDMSVWLWDEEWDCVSTLTTQGDTKCVKFIESTGLMVGGFDGFLRIFSEDQDDFVEILKIDIQTTIWDMSVNPIDQIVAISDDHGYVWLFDYSQMAWDPIEEEDWVGNRGFRQLAKMKVHERACYALTFSPEGDYLVTVGGDNAIGLFKK